MQYMGGKVMIAKKLVAVINALLVPGQAYVEPFLGGCNVAPLINPDRELILADLHPDLIALYKAVASGWVPPSVVTEEEYKRIKALPVPDPLRGFAGFGCSFRGKFFRGYARDVPSRGAYAAGAAFRNMEKARPCLARARLFCASYADISLPQGSLIYCDPPYAGTSGYSTGKFNHASFWQWCRDRVAEGHTVLVSEYSAPKDFRILWSTEKRCNMNPKDKIPRTEKLFCHVSQA